MLTLNDFKIGDIISSTRAFYKVLQVDLSDTEEFPLIILLHYDGRIITWKYKKPFPYSKNEISSEVFSQLAKFPEILPLNLKKKLELEMSSDLPNEKWIRIREVLITAYPNFSITFDDKKNGILFISNYGRFKRGIGLLPRYSVVYQNTELQNEVGLIFKHTFRKQELLYLFFLGKKFVEFEKMTWKPLTGFKGYEINNKGLIRRILDGKGFNWIWQGNSSYFDIYYEMYKAKNKIKKYQTGINLNVYLIAIFSRNNSRLSGTFYLHKKMGEIFLDNPSNLSFVRFKNPIQFWNVSPENLYWTNNEGLGFREIYSKHQNEKISLNEEGLWECYVKNPSSDSSSFKLEFPTMELAIFKLKTLEKVGFTSLENHFKPSFEIPILKIIPDFP